MIAALPHRFPVRIYYEDTDHGRVVYYANYLKFMERARTEFLRERAIDLIVLEQTDRMMFAVTEAHIHYLAPARLNDLLHVETCLTTLQGARLAFSQRIRHNHDTLVDADIHLACIDLSGKPKRIPVAVSQALEAS